MNERQWHKIALAALVLIGCTVPQAHSLAATVLLRIEATNPRDGSRDVPIKSMLPQGIGPHDILSTEGLAVGYDVNNKAYFVHGSISLNAKETRCLDIALRDIWLVPDDKLDLLEAHVQSIIGQFRQTGEREESDRLARDIVTEISHVRVSQGANSAAQVGVLKHIDVYVRNADVLRSVKRKLLQLENAAIAAGYTVDKLLGEPDPPPAPVATAKQEKRAIIVLSARNTSPTDPREVDIRHLLPQEITADDIIDAAGLFVGLDQERKQLMVHQRSVVLPPGQRIEHRIVLRDKWDVNAPRMERLETQTSQLLSQMAHTKENRSAADQLRSIMAGIAMLREARAPQTVDETYVAFFRSQTEAIQRLETQLARVQALPARPSAPGSDTPHPDRRTTWMIIYIILGVLGVLSVAMFFQYVQFGKSKEQNRHS